MLRSTDAEVLGPVIGVEGFLTAPNAAAFDAEVQKIDLMMFNFVFADAQGTIGHRAILHGCTIGDGALIGMGATVLNGATIGEGALIGAGALIAEGKDIPAGALVMGAPGKVIRMLDGDAIAGLRASAARYRANAARFRDGLRAAD